MQTRYDVTAHNGYTVIKKKIGKKFLEVDTRRPHTVYMQYGYSGGVGPWHCTSGIHYGANRFGFDAPGLWCKKTRAALPGLFAMVEKITNQPA